MVSVFSGFVCSVCSVLSHWHYGSNPETCALSELKALTYTQLGISVNGLVYVID